MATRSSKKSITYPYDKFFDISALLCQDLYYVLRTDDIYLALFQVIHCNMSWPEYQNVYYPSDQSKYVYVFKNSSWKKRHIESVIHELITLFRDQFAQFVNEAYFPKDSQLKYKLISYIRSIDDPMVVKKLTQKFREMLIMSEDFLKKKYDSTN